MSGLPELERRFAHLGMMRGGILLLPADAALELVDAAREAGVPVGGIDSFRLEAGRTIPRSEHTLDLYGPFDGSEWDEAASFIRARRELGLHFEVVLLE